jgi:hypothetical protein
VRRAIAAALVVAGASASGAPAGGATTGPRVHVMVAGRTHVLLAPRTVPTGATSVAVASRRCAVGAATPLAALVAARRGGGPSFSVRDYGACDARAADSGSLFVFRIGADRNRGRNGWTYKVGNRSGSTGAADLSGAFGTGRRLRAGDRVTWFWCVLSRSGSCQRTLAVVPAARRVSPGAMFSVKVLGYDDAGHAVRVAGAKVRLDGATAVTGSDGTARFVAPVTAGRVRLSATRSGMVPAFPSEVRVG